MTTPGINMKDLQIESLEVKGFRSLYDVTFRPGRLNVVIGPNRAGEAQADPMMGTLLPQAVSP